MGSQYIPPPEQNVVNVGDEISINALNGIAQANPAITSTNPVATNNSVATAVSGKADLSGASFTGNVTTTGRMGIGGPVPVNANNKLGIYDGNIVFGAGWGLAFGDGTSITSANHSHSISDVTSLQTTLDGKANLSGATFTGKITGTPSASSAGLNVGTVTSTPTTPVNGDIWVGDNLNFRDKNGVSKMVLAATGANAIISNTSTNFPLSITQSGNGGGLKITNSGTGDCIRIEDENPDTTPFVINSAGKVGIGVAPDSTAALKVDANGIMFNDGTTQTTAQSGYLKAFVAFNGSFTPPTVTILAGQSSGVSSVVKNSTGNYTINFSSIFPNQYYIVSINGKRAGLNEPVFGYASSRSNSSVTIQVGVGSFSPVDADEVNVSIISI